MIHGDGARETSRWSFRKLMLLKPIVPSDSRLYFILAGVTSCEQCLSVPSVCPSPLSLVTYTRKHVPKYVCVCVCVRAREFPFPVRVRVRYICVRVYAGECTMEQDVRSCAQPRGGTGNSIDGSFCSLTGDRSTQIDGRAKPSRVEQSRATRYNVLEFVRSPPRIDGQISSPSE